MVIFHINNCVFQEDGITFFSHSNVYQQKNTHTSKNLVSLFPNQSLN